MKDENLLKNFKFKSKWNALIKQARQINEKYFAIEDLHWDHVALEVNRAHLSVRHLYDAINDNDIESAKEIIINEINDHQDYPKYTYDLYKEYDDFVSEVSELLCNVQTLVNDKLLFEKEVTERKSI